MSTPLLTALGTPLLLTSLLLGSSTSSALTPASSTSTTATSTTMMLLLVNLSLSLLRFGSGINSLGFTKQTKHVILKTVIWDVCQLEELS